MIDVQHVGSLLAVVPLALLPVVTFLLLLVYLDSYQVVRIRVVVAMLVAGGIVAVVCYALNGELMALLHMHLAPYSRWVAPVVEETLKASVVVWLFRTHRVGFLADSAILGFAVGAGFAVTENIYYLYLAADTTMPIWIVRGFGTAIMHGGVTAIFAIVTQTLAERGINVRLWHCLPGWLAAVFIHSAFNHFYIEPVWSALGVVVAMPLLLYLVFRISAHRTHNWLEVDFDENARLMQMIDSGHFSSSPVGAFLNGLRDKLDGAVVADMLCYLRVYTELALRAKGLLMMREHGLDVKMDDDTRAKFEEMHYLERSIGATGRLTMRPFLQMTTQDLWQLYMLEQ
ncbi:MAG: PrsW family glutamic-type intramembrane protease [Rhodanobacteraceae bacterium]